MEEARQTTLSDFMEKEKQEYRFEPPKEYNRLEYLDLFKDPNEKKAVHKKEVKVTRNKSGPDRYVIRFGFSGSAARGIETNNWTHVMPSFIERDRTRIYFRFFNDKAHKYAYKLCRTSDSGGGFYFTFSPSEKADKLYQTWYVNKSFNIQYDAPNDCNYITIEEED